MYGMFYPPAPCPQYYSIYNDWNTTPAQCMMYSLPTVPVIVNSPMSTQICPYSIPMDTPAIPVTNEISPLVYVSNEFSPEMSIEVSSIGTPMNGLSPLYSDISYASNGFPIQPNEVAFCGTPLSNCSSYALFSNEVAPLSNQLSCASYEYSSSGTPMLGVMPTVQVSNEYIPIVTPRSDKSYAHFDLELPKHTDYEEVYEENGEIEYPLPNSLDFYCSLPKDLFPTARMMTIDPNIIIDEFCKVSSVDDNAWILDLEFGVPKYPVTRRVATYNVKYNSIHCKNAPEAIHPGFEKCDKNLKRVLLFYYDCVISNWYRGYMAISADRSVENFQSWLLLPMQMLGMCWP